MFFFSCVWLLWQSEVQSSHRLPFQSKAVGPQWNLAQLRGPANQCFGHAKFFRSIQLGESSVMQVCHKPNHQSKTVVPWKFSEWCSWAANLAKQCRNVRCIVCILAACGIAAWMCHHLPKLLHLSVAPRYSQSARLIHARRYRNARHPCRNSQSHLASCCGATILMLPPRKKKPRWLRGLMRFAFAWARGVQRFSQLLLWVFGIHAP